jgi:hypothetical protein
MSFKHPIKGGLNVEIRGYRSRKNQVPGVLRLGDAPCHLEGNYMGKDGGVDVDCDNHSVASSSMSCHNRRSVRLVEDARSEGRRSAFFHEQEEITSASAGSTAASAPPPARR